MTGARASGGPRAATVVVAVTLAVVAAVLPAPAGARADAAAGWVAGDPVPGRLVVTFEAAQGTIHTGLGDAVPLVRGPLRLDQHSVVVEVAAGEELRAARRLAALPGVRAVEADRYLELLAVPDDPRYAEQWAHEQADAERAWSRETGSLDVRVAIVDSGFRGDHPDLVNNVVEEQVVIVDGAVRGTGLRIDNDDCRVGHGTQVAGVAGAEGDNGIGVAGVAWRVSLVDIAVLHSDASCRLIAFSDIAAAINHAVTRAEGAVDVINLSLGAPADSCPTALQLAVDAARNAGAVVVAGTGNDQRALPGSPQIPAACNGVIAVGATGRDGAVASYSSGGDHVDLVAPGGDFGAGGEDGLVLSTGWNLDEPVTTGVEGTSFAAPYVAGVAALVRARDPDMAPDLVESLLERTALDIDAEGRDAASGWGLVQAGAALARIDSGEPVPPPEPDPPFPVGVGLTRLAADLEHTAAITQAVAVSGHAFPARSAVHAVVARADDYADALAGSALGYGVGPLLFTTPEGPLDPATRTELQRVLPTGAAVYLLGGAVALSPGLEAELRTLGFEPRRLAGHSREETAVAVADEVSALGLPLLPGVLLATRGNWPDAVTAGGVAAWFGLPVLLTPSDALHPATAAALARLAPQRLLVVGGPAAVTDAVMAAAGDAAGTPAEGRQRLGGAARDETAVSVARAMEELLRESGRDPGAVLAVNVDRDDGFAHVLSATMIVGTTAAVLVPVRGAGGDVLTTPAIEYVRGKQLDAVIVGGLDLVTDEVAGQLQVLLSQA